MTARDYLSQLRHLDLMIDHKLRELSDLRAKASAIGGFDYSKDRVMTSPPPDAPYAQTIQRIADLDAELNADIDRFITKRHDIIEQIHGIDDERYSEVLYHRYVEYKPFEMIAKEMSYSCSHIRRLHGYALRRFEAQFPITLMLQDFKDDTQ